MLGRVLLAIGGCLVLIGSAFLDGDAWAAAAVMCSVGAGMMFIPVFVTYMLPTISWQVRRLIARLRRDRGLRVFDGGRG